MAEHEDRELGERYRELGREEPPHALDEKILAAARRRPGMRRWALPLSVAAVIVLSVTVTLEMQRERTEEAKQIMQVRPEPPVAEPKIQNSAPRALPAPAAPAAGRLSRESADRERFERAAPAAAEERAQQLAGAESPEHWLERIAELRRAGRDDEADRLLAEFRRRFPDYRIPEAALRRVERR